MGTHMKTTIDIADALFEEAQLAARRRGITMRALVELGLREVLSRPEAEVSPFKLRDASVGGQGLQEGVRSLDWDAIRELSYGERAR